MAEISSIVNRQLLFDSDGDAPIPAAEVLIGLKRGTNHKYSAMSGARTRNHSHHKSSNHKRKNYEDDIENETYTELPVTKRRKRGSRQKLVETDNDSWEKSIRTFLRLPKALSWCRYEWFCSDIDRLFLGGENDFTKCLYDVFPNLKTRTLSSFQWRIIRRMIGKPRRCSSMFFTEERALLDEKRRRVRDIQQKIHQGTLTLSDFKNLHSIPDRIPTILTVGTRVTAFLNIEKDKGFHTGTVEAVDIEKSQYWITFDKPDMGKFSIPDTDIQPILPCEYISLSSLHSSHAARQLAPTTPQSSYCSTATMPAHNPEVPDPLLPSTPIGSRTRVVGEDHLDQQQQQHSLGGFPTVLLKQVVEMSKLLSLKQERVRRISLLNKEAEKMHARHVPFTQIFQKHYATVVIDLDDINRQLNLRSEAVKKYCGELGYDGEPYQLNNSQECLQHAQEIVSSSNDRLKATGSEISNGNALDLISKLTNLLLQIELLSQGGRSQNLSGLQSSIKSTLNSIHQDNYKIFQKHIETPLALIQSGMNPSDTLHPFSVSNMFKKPLKTTSPTVYSPHRTNT